MRTRQALLHRGRAHRGVVAAAFATVLLTLTVVTTVALLQRTANEAAVTGVLTGAGPLERMVRVEAGLEGDADLDVLDDRVRRTLGSSLAPVDLEVHASTVSASYALPGARDEDPNLTVFSSYAGLLEAAELVGGSWPTGSRAGRVEIAMPRRAAELLEVAPGDRWIVRNRFTEDRVEVELTGVFVARRAADPVWLGDPLVRRGVEVSSFTTYGPLVVPEATFASRFLDEATASWLADPELAEVPPHRLSALRSGVTGLDRALGEELSVETELGEVIDRVRTPVTATGAVVVLAAAPLLLLALGALVTAGRLLADRRRAELALLRARGASTTQLGVVALAEAAMITAPAVLFAPMVAALLVAASGPGRAAGGPLVADGSTWWLAGMGGAVAALALAAPAWREDELSRAVRSRGAGPRRATAPRLAAEVVVLACAAVAAWQLEQYDGPVRAGRADPLLVLVPALLLLAGCLVVLRVLPLVLGTAQSYAARSRGLTGALAAWTVSRELGRLVGPMLAVALSASVLAFSATWLSSWGRSVEDRAAFATGADVRIQDHAEVLTPAEVARLPAVSAAIPVARSDDAFGDLRAELLGLDVEAADGVVGLRDDLAGAPLTRLLAVLDEQTPAGLTLPEGAVAVDLRLSHGDAEESRGSWVAVVQDGAGLLHRAELERTRGPFARAELGTLTSPVTFLGVRLRTSDDVIGPTGPLLHPVDVDGRRGEPLALADGASWRSRSTSPGVEVVTVAAAGGADPLPVVVTRELASRGGDRTLVSDAHGLSLRLEVVGVVDGLPTVDPAESAGVLADLTMLNRAVFEQSGDVPTADREWWLAVDGDPAATAAQAGRDGVTALDRQSTSETLRSGPVGTALTGVLGVALLTGGLTALSGVVASAGALGPARRREAALLRALGAEPRQISRLAVLDRLGVLTVAGVSGAAVGVGVAWWTAPRITLTDTARAPYPPLLVEVPWALLALAAATALVAALALHALSARRRIGLRGRARELP